MSQETTAQTPLFPDTQWDWIALLKTGDEKTARSTLELLCRGYWYPLYAHLRYKGLEPEDARDLTQDFFLKLIRNNALPTADQSKGRLRTFLLTSLDRHLINHRSSASSLKRGSQFEHLPLDLDWAENRFTDELTEPVDPDESYLQNWRKVVLDQARQTLRSTYLSRDEGDLFDHLYPHLEQRAEAGTYAKIAHELERSESSLRVALTRLRKRLAETIREQISETVNHDPELAQKEIKELLGES